MRQGYLFDFQWSTSGELLEDSGYERAQLRQLEVSSPTCPERSAHLRRYLEGIGATSGELLAMLGEPSERVGWWPIENWTYSHGLELELRLGIVEQALV